MAQRHNGVVHRNRCACPLCDPDGKLLEQARGKFLEERRAARSAPAVQVAAMPRRPPAQRRPLPTVRDRRFRELLAKGLPAARAMKQVEAEFPEGG